MDSVLSKIIKLLPERITDVIPKEADPSCTFLLQKAELVTNPVRDRDDLKVIIQGVQAVLDMTWEQLNTGHWKEVKLHQRQLYTAATILKIILLLVTYNLSEDEKNIELLNQALSLADKGLLMGAPLEHSTHADLTQIAQILSEAINSLSERGRSVTSSFAAGTVPETSKLPEICGIIGQSIPVLKCPSLESFQEKHFRPRLPVKLTECMNHWPAMKLWPDMGYLIRLAGPRIVPIELGVHYADPGWSQKLMKLADFIETYITNQELSPTVGYLAQHQLFDQIPGLKADICEPEYCCISDCNSDNSEPEETDINAWFGPRGTVSPLHFDPKHNLLSQVVGTKRVLLYDPDESSHLYPHAGNLLSNTAQVDPEHPDYTKYPEYKLAHAWECQLNPGEMLYIPPAWWHHVRSLTTSFSVSFWWK